MSEKKSSEHQTIKDVMDPLAWLAEMHLARTVGDLDTKRSLFVSCLTNDAMYLKDKYDDLEESENCTEAAISAFCQASGFLFAQVAGGFIDKNQLKTRIA